MKKYFIKGSDEPLEWGDVLNLTVVTHKNGRAVQKDFECKLTPDLIPMLLAEEIIEEKEVKEKKQKTEPKEDLLEFSFEKDDKSSTESDLDEIIETIIDTQKMQSKILQRLTDQLDKVQKSITPVSSKPVYSITDWFDLILR